MGSEKEAGELSGGPDSMQDPTTRSDGHRVKRMWRRPEFYLLPAVAIIATMWFYAFTRSIPASAVLGTIEGAIVLLAGLQKQGNPDHIV